MSRTKTEGRVVAMALTWDGARWPVKSLPPKARAFLAGKVSTSKSLTQSFADDQIRELRICWVPRLKGGETISEPFPLPERLCFQMVRLNYFNDVCAVIYRRLQT